MEQLTYAVCTKCQGLNRFAVSKQRKPICGSCKADLPVHGSVIDVTDYTFHKLVQKSPLPVIVDVWAPWCGPCRAFAPTFEEFSQKYIGKFVFAKLNSDDNQHVSGQLGIRSIPTILVYKNGHEVTRQSGMIPREHFDSWIQQF